MSIAVLQAGWMDGGMDGGMGGWVGGWWVDEWWMYGWVGGLILKLFNIEAQCFSALLAMSE